MRAEVEVLEPGLLTSVQDPFGRPGWRRYGVPVTGAADAFSARLANRLVGNPDAATLLEVTLLGPTLRLTAPAAVGLAGADLGAEVDRVPLAPGRAMRVRAGATIRFGSARRGLRAYLAFAGGIAEPIVLGSRATDLRSGFGGHEGRRLAAGDRLMLGDARQRPLLRRARSLTDAPEGPIRVTKGPHVDRFAAGALDAILATKWTVRVDSDRAGVRLDGAPLVHADPSSAEIAPVGLPLGAIQVPADGRPILALVDRPVTGGYPVIACIARADVARVAQLGAGAEVRFAVVDVATAVAALRAREAELDDLEAADPPDEHAHGEPDAGDAEADTDAGWAGSLD
jgi:biotin-dependent carboxylase-like uncharacterized protein